MNIPKTHILVVSFRRDYEFFTYFVRSYKKFCRGGFTGITVVVPYNDEPLFKPFCEANGVIVRSYYEAKGKEFLHHQVVKLEAELWVPKDTEVVAHIDSDCFFQEPFEAGVYFYNGLPRLSMERYSDFEWYPARYSWKMCVDYALGGNHEWETMTQHPELYWIDTYKRLRDHIETRHHFPFTQFVLLQRNEFPQTFAEHPCCGAFALDYDAHRYQQVIQVHHPGVGWSDEKWRKFGIQPRIWTMATRSVEHQDKIQGWSTKTLFVFQEENGLRYEEMPLPNPLIQFWSHRGTLSYRQQMEAILA